MKFTECIQKNRKSKLRKMENIELLKPVVNLFLGDFAELEEAILVDFLDERIGSREKINYAGLCFGGGAAAHNGKVKVLQASDADFKTEYGLKNRSLFKDAVLGSKQLELAIGDYSSEIFNRVARYTYQLKGIIRINVIIKAESHYSAVLDHVIALFKQKFGILYTEGVYVDVYCILDQREYSRKQNADERKAFNYLSLTELNRIAGDGDKINMAFCLSNYDSRDRLMGDSNETSIRSILTAVGLMIIAKDGISASKSGSADYYNDLQFKVNSRQHPGHIYSLGYMRLEKIPEAIEYITYKSVLEMYRESNPRPNLDAALERLGIKPFQSIGDRVVGAPALNRPILTSMVKDTTVGTAELNYKTRGEIINDVYGKNIDLFIEFNNKDDYESRLANEIEVRTKNVKDFFDRLLRVENASVYAVNEIINAVVDSLKTTISSDYNTGSQAAANLEEWLNGKERVVGQTELVRETKEPVVFYKMAEEYSRLKLDVLKSEIYGMEYDCLLDVFRELSSKYQKIIDTLQTTSGELEEGIDVILESENESELRAGNCEEYYSSLVRTTASANKNQFKNFIQQLNGTICTDYNEEKLFNSILAYCNDAILADNAFGDDFSVEMLKRLKDYKKLRTEDDIYNMAYNTILDNQTFFVNYISTGSINNEICFFVNTNSRFVESTSERMQELRMENKIKVFYEDHFGGIDILFMEGCFAVQNIHGFPAMEQVYKKLNAEG